MSSIPPNIAMALLQAQFAAKEASKPADSERNKRIRDSKQLAQLADQQQHEVEDATEADSIHIHPEDEQRNKKQQEDGNDTFECQLEEAVADQSDVDSDSDNSADSEELLNQNSSPDDPPDDTPSHIDLSA